MTGELYAALDLLDRQVEDRDGELVGKVDDLELAVDRQGTVRVVALLLGPQALGGRLRGHFGRWIAGAGRRLSGSSGPVKVRVGMVEDFGVTVKLKAATADVPGARALEGWLRQHFVERIPGSRHGSE